MRSPSFVFSSIALFAATLMLAAQLRAETYVEEPAFGRPVVGVDVYAGAPVASDDGSSGAVGGGGTEVFYGYAWEGGWSLHGVFGGARWSSRGTFGDAVGDREASISEGYAGLAVRYAFLDGAVTPFVQAMAVSEVLRVRGPIVARDPFGVGCGAEVGARWRQAPLDAWIAFDARTSRFDDAVSLTRASLVVGVFLDLR